jgi:hypothetical protein
MSFFEKLFQGGGTKEGQDDIQVSDVQVQNDMQVQNDEQLIAVITAAIAAFEGSKSVSNLIIRRVSREQGSVTVWSNAGRAACMRSRRI